MKEGILGPKVEGIEVLILLDNEINAEYNVYLWNRREVIIEGVIITSAGFGEHPSTGEKIKTATLRHSLEVLLPNEVAKIEAIMPDVFGLYNEYWVSFWVDEVLYDKQFLFPPESIIHSNFNYMEAFQKKGLLAQ
jgi:hypothetical protein